jgi:hypothetical protein
MWHSLVGQYWLSRIKNDWDQQGLNPQNPWEYSKTLTIYSYQCANHMVCWTKREYLYLILIKCSWNIVERVRVRPLASTILRHTPNIVRENMNLRVEVWHKSRGEILDKYKNCTIKPHAQHCTREHEFTCICLAQISRWDFGQVQELYYCLEVCAKKGLWALVQNIVDFTLILLRISRGITW